VGDLTFVWQFPRMRPHDPRTSLSRTRIAAGTPGLPKEIMLERRAGAAVKSHRARTPT
jgi:hypothetical protein